MRDGPRERVGVPAAFGVPCPELEELEGLLGGAGGGCEGRLALIDMPRCRVGVPSD